MSDKRPKILPNLVATAIESAPARVRRRLDRSPNAASEWIWNSGKESWTVDAGGETVAIPREDVHSLDQLKCTCLLSPNCFHVLACLTTLEIANDVETDNSEVPSIDERNAISESLRPSDKHKKAAKFMTRSISQILQIGIANAGVVAQSGLLRAVHQCRAEGLHRASSIGLRVATGITQFRSRSRDSDPEQLAMDVADLLEITQRVVNQPEVDAVWIGTARRQQSPVRPRKLHGLLAEPIVTRSGFGGAVVYFLGEDDQIYTASDVRPGNAQLARDAYHGGIDIGSLTQPAKQLSRGLYLGTDLTASLDGRLGRGKKVKIVEQGQSSWESDAIQRRFSRPLVDQWNTIYDSAALPNDLRPAGWDFAFLTGVVVGAFGPSLLFQQDMEPTPIRLEVENDHDELLFRHNLRQLSYASGLKLQIIARINLSDPTIVFPLAMVPLRPEEKESAALELPKRLNDRVFLGFDELHPKHLLNRTNSPTVTDESTFVHSDDPLAALHRRWIAKMLAGEFSQRQSRANSIATESAALNRNGFATAASLLDSLSRFQSDSQTNIVEEFLAVAVYLKHSRYELAKTKAIHSLS